MDFRRSLFFRLLRVLCGAAILFAAIAAATKYLVAPALVRSQAQQALGDYWDGTVEIGQVEFDFTGPVLLRNIVLKDTAGRTWATLNNLTARLDNWPGLHPVLADLDGNTLEVRAHFIDGKCRPPLRTPPSPAQVQHIDSLTVRIAPIHLTTCKPDIIPLAANAHAFAQVQNGILTVRATCNQLCQGLLIIDANGSLGPDMAIGDFRGTVNLANVNMPDLLRAIAVKSEMKEGSLSAQLALRGQGPVLAAVRGKGQVQMDRAHLAGIPLVKAILDFVGLADMGNFRVRGQFSVTGPLLTVDQARLVNPISAFEIQPNGTLHLTNKQMDLYVVAAIASGMQNTMGKLHIPVVSPLMDMTGNLLQHLTRIQICGGWADPPETLMHKDFARDLQDGTIKFFTDALTPGGKLGDDTIKSFDELFKAIDQTSVKNVTTRSASSEPTSRPASAPASKPTAATGTNS